MKPMRLTLFLMLAAVIFCGCDKSSSRAAQPTVPQAPDGETIARFHWLGKKQIAAETNSTGLMRIWNEPESARLETQTLDKLSTAPWRLFPHVATTNTAAAPLLRSLLDDCVQQESYLEIRCATNQPGELAFAIRLDAGRAALWKTNLAAVLESLTGIRTTPTGDGWSLKKHKMPNLIELIRKDEWIVVGVGQEKNALAGDFLARITGKHAPYEKSATNLWFDAKFDLRQVAGAFKLDWHLSSGFPEIAVTAIGDGEDVRTRGDLVFPQPLALNLEPWTIPTNLVSESFVSFVAVRGVSRLLGGIKIFSSFPSNSMPNQLFTWDRFGTPPPVYVAFSVNDASNAFNSVASPLIRWLTANVAPKYGMAQMDADATLIWDGLPFGYPFLQAITNSGHQFLLAGFSPPVIFRDKSMPPELAGHIIQETNLIYYDWELTGEKLIHWRYLDDLSRLIFDVRGPLLRQESDSVQWMARNQTNLSLCVTEMKLVQTNRLAFARKSLIGLSALEIELLANWLETPEFPSGFQTLLVTNPLPVDVKRIIPHRATGAANP